MICRKLNINEKELKDNLDVFSLLEQHSRYEIGKNKIQVYRLNGFWRVSHDSVVWNIHIKGADKIEHYRTVQEALYVARMLDSQVSVLNDNEEAAMQVVEVLDGTHGIIPGCDPASVWEGESQIRQGRTLSLPELKTRMKSS